MSKSIKCLIINWQNNDEGSHNTIWNMFSDKLYYWKRRINNPDADSDLDCFLVTLLTDINVSRFTTDNDMLYYIKACIENKGRKIEKDIKRLKEREICCSDSFFFENGNSINDDFSDIEFKDLISSLDVREKQVLYKRYYLQSTDAEISEELHISRQAICKCRKKALGKIMV
ncbi:MAG: sigma factor-like helix-turn-helix DNA-binding protein [Clostridium sp.]